MFFKKTPKQAEQSIITANENGGWVYTFSGHKFDYLNPKKEEIDIIDIAHSLSHQCRFNGHTPTFFSVAQHSAIISNIVSQENALWGLLHDATETYIGDLPSPLKGILPEYKALENLIFEVIASKFGLSPEIPEEVKVADKRMLATEARDLFGVDAVKEWNLPFSPFSMTIKPVNQPTAFKMFIEQYKKLTTKTKM